MTLTLTPNTEARLLALAARRRQTPEAVIDAVIEREVSEAGAVAEGERISLTKHRITRERQN